MRSESVLPSDKLSGCEGTGRTLNDRNPPESVTSCGDPAMRVSRKGTTKEWGKREEKASVSARHSGMSLQSINF